MTKFLSSVKKLCASPMYTKATFKTRKETYSDSFIPYICAFQREKTKNFTKDRKKPPNVDLFYNVLGDKVGLFTSQEIFQIFIHRFKKRVQNENVRVTLVWLFLTLKIHK